MDTGFPKRSCSTNKPARRASPGAALEHQRGPAVAGDPTFERQRPISGDHRVRLRRQNSGQHDVRAGRDQPAQRRGEAHKRPEQDIGEDEVERRASAQPSVASAVGAHHCDHAAGAVAPRVGARGRERLPVDVGRECTAVQRAGGGAQARRCRCRYRECARAACPPFCRCARAPGGSRGSSRDGRCRRRARPRFRCRCD